jgi:hypothetical protein
MVKHALYQLSYPPGEGSDPVWGRVLVGHGTVYFMIEGVARTRTYEAKNQRFFGKARVENASDFGYVIFKY